MIFYISEGELNISVGLTNIADAIYLGAYFNLYFYIKEDLIFYNFYKSKNKKSLEVSSIFISMITLEMLLRCYKLKVFIA